VQRHHAIVEARRPLLGRHLADVWRPAHPGATSHPGAASPYLTGQAHLRTRSGRGAPREPETDHRDQRTHRHAGERPRQAGSPASRLRTALLLRAALVAKPRAGCELSTAGMTVHRDANLIQSTSNRTLRAGSPLARGVPFSSHTSTTGTTWGRAIFAANGARFTVAHTETPGFAKRGRRSMRNGSAKPSGPPLPPPHPQPKAGALALCQSNSNTYPAPRLDQSAVATITDYTAVA
jgi:hypothetical protein